MFISLGTWLLAVPCSSQEASSGPTETVGTRREFNWGWKSSRHRRQTGNVDNIYCGAGDLSEKLVACSNAAFAVSHCV